MAMTITADDVLRDLLTTDEGKRDPYPFYRALHDLAPFHRSEADGMVYACRYDTCRQLLLDPHLGHDEEKFFRRPGMTDAQRERMRKRMEKRRQRGFSMVTENPPDHTRLRRLVSRAFTTPRVDQLKDRVVGLVDEGLAQVTFARLRERFTSLELLDPEPPRAYSFLRGLRSLPVRVHPR
jgi:cytochrome P450